MSNQNSTVVPLTTLHLASSKFVTKVEKVLPPERAFVYRSMWDMSL
jgi:hypothetical protein